MFRILPLFFAALFFASICARAQTSNTRLPKNPPLQRAPAFSSWTVQFKYKDEDAAEKKAAATPFLGDRIRTIVVTKTNKTYREEVTMTSGKTYQKWTFDGMQLRSLPDRASIVPIDPPTSEVPSPEFTDYRKGDFAGLEWIAVINFKGTSEWQGGPVYQFESNGKTAGLSQETQLPIYATTPDTSEVYTFNPPPTSPLVPPKEFIEAVETHKRGLEALKFHPSLP